MALKFRKKIILVKKETVYGTDSVPTGAANAVLTNNLTITPLEADIVNRDTDRPTLGNDLAIHVGARVRCEFEVELAGTGSAGITPKWGRVANGCAISNMSNPGVDVTFFPVSSNEEHHTMYMHFDGQKHAIVGARGSMAFTINTSGIPVAKFNFVGLWTDPVSIADPVPDYTQQLAPLPVTNTNTPTFTIDGATFEMLSFEFDMRNEVVYRNVVGSESVQIVDRAPGGKLIIEAPPLSTRNFFTDAKSHVLSALQLVHGTQAGNIFQFDAAQTQFLNPAYGESDGVRTLEMDLAFIPTSAGDDEFQIIAS